MYLHINIYVINQVYILYTYTCSLYIEYTLQVCVCVCVCVCVLFIVQLLSCVHSAKPWIAACYASLFFTNSQSLLKLVSIELVMLNHLILCHPLLLLPSIFPSTKIISSVLALRLRWPKFWSFNFSISSFNEYLGFVSFRINWFNLLAVPGTLKYVCILDNSIYVAYILYIE